MTIVRRNDSGYFTFYSRIYIFPTVVKINGVKNLEANCQMATKYPSNNS